ncbi:MAG: hypothetical protein OMM_09550 [Candidatus Magnetoglobus multicellularis str. Araruama]|uniref:DUF5615 domain-containing protein n=1 Tax=Candidatus Magnetoglobus multicellularis str. Araruama TaxID=890399 RepID=A0A1V1P3W6_9BACT|nr:MAG: hypothetical protein OMM_09550 [Candidatus Magnetoglobus multicellularis str. Araruama]
MKFLVDECTGPTVAKWLRNKQYDVFSVFDDARGVSDDFIIQKAYKENRIIVTNDKDFGEKVFREKYPHKGVILLRLDDDRWKNKIEVLEKLLDNYSKDLVNQFVVVSEDRIRFAQLTLIT